MFAVQADGRKLTTIEGLAQPDGTPGALQDAFCEAHATAMRLLHPGHDRGGACPARNPNPAPAEHEIREAIGGNLCRCTGYQQIVDAIKLAARQQRGANAGMSAAAEQGFRYIGKKRRTKEDPRFVTGRGRFVADIALPGMKHVALVSSPHAAARIKAIRTDRALALTGVHYVLTGAELCAAVPSRCCPGVDAPKVTRYPLAHGVVRYAGEWVAAVVADSARPGRGRGRDESKSTTSRPTMCSTRRRRVAARLPAGASGCTAATCCTGASSSGARWKRISPRAEHKLAFRARWARSATVPIETFGVVGALGSGPAAARCVGFDPDAEVPRPDRRARCACRAMRCACISTWTWAAATACKRGIKHTVLVGYLARQARHAGAPDRGSAGKHARRRHARARPHLRRAGRIRRRTARIRSLKIRALDDVGAYAGRAPLQLGKPVGAIVGPYQHPQRRVRADLGDDQQDGAGGGARLRPVADQLRAGDRASTASPAICGMDRIELRTTQFHPER